MQGRLRNEPLTVEVESSCAHCGNPIHLTLDGELVWSVKEAGDCEPLLFEPEVDWSRLHRPNIIGDY